MRTLGNICRWPMCAFALITAASLMLTFTATTGAQGCNPQNLLQNCSFEEGWHPGTNGYVPNGWTDFQIEGRPRYEISDFEKLHGAKGLRIWNDSLPFKAGIYQQVPNVTPGTWYRVIVHWSPIQATVADPQGGAPNILQKATSSAVRLASTRQAAPTPGRPTSSGARRTGPGRRSLMPSACQCRPGRPR
jgi:hypothetical protein